MSKKVVIIGAGGHGKVISDIVIQSGDTLIGYLDDNQEKNTRILENYKILGKIEDCKEIQKQNPDYYFIIAIGDNSTREKLAEKYKLNYYTAVHPKSTIGLDVQIKEGTTIMANTCINSSTRIGNHCIINTGSIIEHDNKISSYVHISPNATCCGSVNIGRCAHICAGAIIINNINIIDECIIGAGAVVVKNIKEKGTYIGVPARRKL